ncbi:hypothetical protein BC629DRAFT_802388 [Irpex lacteus]|nr:hypothetical protein BC629DRAFT_802388 [Irpex lacteus]
MSRRMSSLWRTVLGNIRGLPPCPEGVSEPLYTSFVFDQHCNMCWKNNCQSLYTTCMVRLCDECRYEREIRAEESDFDQAAMEIIKPHQLKDLVPVVRTFQYKPMFYKPALTKFLAALKKAPANEREAFLATTERLLLARKKLEGCAGLYLRRQVLTQNSNRGMVNCAGIIKRLKEEGYEPELTYMKKHKLDAYKRFRESSAVNQPRPLTDRIWDTIKDGLLKTMRATRKERLFEVKKAVLLERLGYVSRYIEDTAAAFTDCPLSSLEVTLCVPGVYEFLDRDAHEFNATSFVRFLHEAVPPYRATYEERVRDALGTMVRGVLSIPAETNPFKLAVAMWLSCIHCQKVFTLQQVPKHSRSCSTLPYYHRPETPPPQELIQDMIPKPIQSVFLEKLSRGVSSPPWGGDWRRFQRGLQDGAAIVEACGFDAKTATIEDLDRADVRLTCTNHGSYKIPVMTWRSAIHHASTIHSSRGPECERADEGVVEAAKPFEAKAEEVYLHTWESRWTYKCVRCSDVQRSTRASVTKHLQEHHHVDEPTEEDCIDLQPSIMPPGTVYLFSNRARQVMNARVEYCLEVGIGRMYDISESS